MSRRSTSASNHPSPGGSAKAITPNGHGIANGGAAPPLMTSEEVNLLVHAYLAESGFTHAAFTMVHESPLGSSSALRTTHIPPAHLIRILQKGLLYMTAEAAYRGDDTTRRPPRLVGYKIPDTIPLPAVPEALSEEERAAVATIRTKGKAKAVEVQTDDDPPADPKGKGRARDQEVDVQMQEPAPMPPPKQTGERSVQTEPPPATAEKGVQKIEKPPPLAIAPAKPEAPKLPASKPEGVKTPASSASLQKPPGEKKRKASNDSSADPKRAKTLNSPSTSTTALPTPGPPPTSTKPAFPPGIKSWPPVKPPEMGKQRSLSPSVSRHPAPVAAERRVSVNVGRPRASSASNGCPMPPKDKERPVKPKDRDAEPTTAAPKSKSKSSDPDKATKPLAPPISTAEDEKLSKSSDVVSNSSGANGAAAMRPTTSSGPVANARHEGGKGGRPLRVVPIPDALLLRGSPQNKKGRGWSPLLWHPSRNEVTASMGDSCVRSWEIPANWVKGTVFEKDQSTEYPHKSLQRKLEITSMQFNHDGTLLATGADDGVLRVFSPAGSMLAVLTMHQRSISCIKWTKSNDCVTGSLDNTACLWDIEHQKVRQQWATHQTGPQEMHEVEVIDDQNFVSCAGERTIHIITVGKAHATHRFKGHSDDINTIAINPNKTKLASGGDEGEIRVWALAGLTPSLAGSEVEDGEEVGELSKKGGCVVLQKAMDKVAQRDGEREEVMSLAWGCKGGLLSGGSSGTVKLWDVDSSQCLMRLLRHSVNVIGLAFQPGSEEYFATSATAGAKEDEGVVCIWRVMDGALAWEYTHQSPVYDLVWHPTRLQIAVAGPAGDNAVFAIESKP